MKKVKYLVGISVGALLVFAVIFDLSFLIEIMLVIAFLVMTWAAYVLIKNLDKEYRKQE